MNVRKSVPQLTPVQQVCYGALEALSEASPLVALCGDAGSGRTTLLETFQREHGGHLLRFPEILAAISTVPSERTDTAIFAHLQLLMKEHDLILVDDFTNLMENCHPGFPVLGYRRFYFARLLMPVLADMIVNSGKKLIMAGRHLTQTGANVPDPIESLYASKNVALVTLGQSDGEDYAALSASYAGADKAARLDFNSIYKVASGMNCYQLIAALDELEKSGQVNTDAFIAYLVKNFIRANARTDEIEEIEFSSLPGFADIAAKLQMQIVLPMQNIELAEKLNLRPKRGVLLYGPPGTGKTTIGRALAHKMKGKFFLIDGTILTDWPGSFFGRVRWIVEQAKANAPSLIFIDDADLLFAIPHIAGLPRYLLSLLDGIESETASKVCVMMTAMDPANIPEALLRSGRAELWLETKLPDAPTRAQILKPWVEQGLADTGVADLGQVADATPGFTPADLRRLVADAKSLYAVDRVRGSAPADATQYLLRAAVQIEKTRSIMSGHVSAREVAEVVNAAQLEAVDLETFDPTVLESDVPVLVDFWAPWCGPCAGLAPVLEGLAQQYGDSVRMVKVDCDSNPELSKKYQVRNIPRILVFRNGEVVADRTGVPTRPQLEEMLAGALALESA